MTRLLKCECGDCNVCKSRERMRIKYAAMSVEERREIVARRDKEKARLRDRLRYDRDHEKKKAWSQQWREANPGRATAQRRQWIDQHPEKRSAYNAIQYALRNGQIARPDACEKCGEAGRVEAHHADYSKKLEVQWLCKNCHGATHRLPRSAAS
jgi:hypothetical protein